jgi:SAM-dependent methyltransferase
MPPLLTPFLTRQRMKAITPYLEGDVLDLACGYAMVIPLLQPGQGYLGIEGSTQFIKTLSGRYPTHRFLQRNLDQDALDLDQKFDTILLVAIIEHLKRPDRLVAQLPRYLNPGGRVVMTTPSPFGDKIHRAGARLGLFSKDAVEEHQTIFSHQMMVELLTPAGLAVEGYRRFLLGGNQLFICRSSKPDLNKRLVE